MTIPIDPLELLRPAMRMSHHKFTVSELHRKSGKSKEYIRNRCKKDLQAEGLVTNIGKYQVRGRMNRMVTENLYQLTPKAIRLLHEKYPLDRPL